MVLVDAVKYGFLEALLGGHAIGAAKVARGEAKFYRDAGGVHPIDLESHISAGRLVELSATQGEVDAIAARLQRRLGPGEVESLALVVARRHRFCTADGAAVRAMKKLDVLDRWVPLEELLTKLDPPRPVPEAKYSRAAAEPK